MRRWGGGFMARVPKWERLSDVLKRVMTAGVSEDEAKSDISGAIADKEIRGVLLTVAVEPDVFAAHRQLVAKVQRLGSDPRHSADSVECFEGANVKVPDHLTPDDFDWQNSRPLQPWRVRPRGGRRDEWQSFSRPALRIELRTADVVAWVERTFSNATRVGVPASVIAEPTPAIPQSNNGVAATVIDEPTHSVPPSEPYRGVKSQVIAEAIDELERDGKLKGITPKDRDNKIHSCLTLKGYSVSKNPPSFARAVQRALRKRRSK
jgi:hypothetical protein